jgi:Type VIII secretion system (T8SS), CsgF protein
MSKFNKITIVFGVMFASFAANASEMVFQFKNPSFSGNGYSTQQLTIENEEYTRKQAIISQQKADQQAAAAAAANSNLNLFLNNLQSRIYAQLSLQLSNAMFSGNATSGSMNFEGSTISWVQDLSTNSIKLSIVDPSGNATNITVPVGTFAFQ